MKRMIKNAYDPTIADTYIVKIWHEVEANAEDTYGPEAAEEIFEIVATSPQKAKEYAMRQWDGPIDRIEIVDINPDPDKYEYEYEDNYIPFDSCDSVQGGTSVKYGPTSPESHTGNLVLIDYLRKHGVSDYAIIMSFVDNCDDNSYIYEILSDLANKSDVNLDEYYQILEEGQGASYMYR